MSPDPDKSSDAHKNLFRLPKEGDGDVPQNREVLQMYNNAADGHRQTLDRAGVRDLFEGLTYGLAYLKHDIYRHYSDVQLARLAQTAQLKLMVSVNEGMECIETFLQLKLNHINNETVSTLEVQNVSAEPS